MKQPIPHAVSAQRYFDWGKRQLELAEKSPNPKVRDDRLALAEFYFKLADGEVAASTIPAPAELLPHPAPASSQHAPVARP